MHIIDRRTSAVYFLCGDVDMPLWGFITVLVATLLLFTVLHALSNRKRPFKRALLSMLAGAVTLAVINLLSPISGVYIPVSVLSVLTSVIGGVPGVTLLLFLNLIL